MENPKTAWEDDTQETLKDKTKKNVALEFGLFSVVFGFFVIFNVYYWTNKKHVFY